MEKASGLEDEFLRIVGGALQVWGIHGIYAEYSWGIHGIYICIGYVSGMYRVCIGKVSKGTEREGAHQV